MGTSAPVEDDPIVLEDEVAMHLEDVENNLANLKGIDVSTDGEVGGGRPASCITSSMTGVEVRTTLEKVRFYLYANGEAGECHEIKYLLSKTCAFIIFFMEFK